MQISKKQYFLEVEGQYDNIDVYIDKFSECTELFDILLKEDDVINRRKYIQFILIRLE